MTYKSIMVFTDISFNRTIIHKIIGKSGTVAAYADTSSELHVLDSDTDRTIKERVFNAIQRTRRFFETEVEQTHENSFWDLAKRIQKSTAAAFIDLSISIANLAAEAHTKKNTPGGLLIIIDSEINKKPAVIVIKAELQEALVLNGTTVEIMKELFLSPAKDFFKIGILIHEKPKVANHNAFKSFVYDDQFTSQKTDLAVYFYRDFLGFTTSKNDKLLTRDFLDDFLEFINREIKDHETRKLLKTRIKADYRESTGSVIDPESYKEFFAHDEFLAKKFQDKVLSKYPNSFSKDLTLVDNSLKKTSLSIVTGIKVVGDANVIDSRVAVFDGHSQEQRTKLKTGIDAGDFTKVITVATLPDIDQEEVDE